MRVSFLGLLLPFAVTGCVNMISVAPLAAEKQSLRYYSGAGLVTSEGKNCTVVFGPLEEVQNVEQETAFFLSVTNRTDQPVLITPRDVSAKAPTGWGGKKEALPVVDRNTHITRLERQRAADRFSAAVVAVSAAMQASQPATSQGYVSSSGQVTQFGGTTYNPAAAASAQAQGIGTAVAMNAQSDARYVSGMNQRALFLAKNTIMPGDTYSSMVAVQAPRFGRKGMDVTYGLNVCGELHIFTCNYKPQRGPSANGSDPNMYKPVF